MSRTIAAPLHGMISHELRSRLVRRIMKDHSFAEQEAESIMDETMDFLAQCAHKPSARHSPSRHADIGWHTFILFTREYARFCQQHAGRFIHHEPNDKDCDSGPGNDCGTTDCNSDGDA